jgi:RimJ/RimL family protein N-acetyltransferase
MSPPTLLSLSPLPDRAAVALPDVAIPDGTPLHIRPLGRDDRAALQAFFARLSPESRRRRFLTPKPEVLPRELTYLTDIDHVRHEALAAIDARGAIVAEGRYAAWSGREDTAEFAIAVLDELQGRRIGTTVAAAAVARARTNGFARLTASTLWENSPARALLRGLGFHAVGSEGGVLELELTLA